MLQASDVYSFAVLAWHLVSSESDFFDVDVMILYYRVVALDARPTFPGGVPDYFRGLVEACWHPMPSSRPKFALIRSKINSFLA